MSVPPLFNVIPSELANVLALSIVAVTINSPLFSIKVSADFVKVTVGLSSSLIDTTAVSFDPAVPFVTSVIV